MASQFAEFLRRELAPTPGRWRATLRITLACIACTIPVMSFHLQQPLMVMIGMFMIAREDISTTALGTLDPLGREKGLQVKRGKSASQSEAVNRRAGRCTVYDFQCFREGHRGLFTKRPGSAMAFNSPVATALTML